MRALAIAILVAACGGGGKHGDDGLRIVASTTHGEHSKDSGSETTTYAVHGADVSWSTDATGAYRGHVDGDQGATTLDDQAQTALAADAKALLAGATVTHPAEGTTYDSWKIHVEVGGQKADLSYQNPIAGDALYDQANALFAKLASLKRR